MLLHNAIVSAQNETKDERGGIDILEIKSTQYHQEEGRGEHVTTKTHMGVKNIEL